MQIDDLLRRNEEISGDKVIDYERPLRCANEVMSIAEALPQSPKRKCAAK